MKKFLSICAILMLCTVTLFAQNSVPVSKTYESTAGLFKTDVDNFVDLNAWKNVDLNNMFASISYNEYKEVEFGFAKNLEKGYLGLWLIGDVGFDFASKSTSSSSETNMSIESELAGNQSTLLTDSSKEYTGNGKRSDFTIGALYGKGDVAYRGSIYYQGNINDSNYKYSSDIYSETNDGSGKKITSTTTEEKNITDRYRLIPEFAVGFDIEKGEKVYNSYAKAILDINKNSSSEYSYSKTDDQDAVIEETEPVNGDKISFTLALGTSFDLAEKENLTQKVAVGTSFRMSFIDDNVVEDDDKEDKIEKTNITEKGENYISIRPSYSFNYKGDERLTVAFKTHANISFTNTTEKHTTSTINNDTEVTDYTDETIVEKNFNSHFVLSPYATLAIAYDVIPSKLTFKAASQIRLPYLVYDLTTSEKTVNTKDVMGDIYTANEDEKTKTSTFDVKGYSMPCSMVFGSGFTYNLSKNLTFDATWNIVSNLFNSTLTSQLSEGETDLMNTLNKVLVHNVSLGITFKM